jgi:DNA invertase Pin-like site-specific DNA recombinase
MIEQAEKVTADHLRRDAYVYIRQATLSQQVVNHDRLQCQYALREKAIALGWPAERVIVTDCDLGQSGANISEREGLRHLLAEVSKGSVGILMVLDVSRLSRNCRDWHHVMEICAASNTLILIADRVHDLAQFNDRLLLGLEQPMCEPELQLSQEEERQHSHEEIH